MRDGRPDEELTIAPMYLLAAEFDDDSIDLLEAADDDEADELMEHLVEQGAVVTTYLATPLSCGFVTLHAPVLDHDN